MRVYLLEPWYVPELLIFLCTQLLFVTSAMSLQRRYKEIYLQKGLGGSGSKGVEGIYFH